MSETKVCFKCGRELPATTEYFYRRVDSGKESLKNACKECSKKHDKEYYRQNQCQVKARHREYYSENKESISIHRKEHYANGGGKERKAQYYQDNIQEIKAKRAEYRKENREKIRENMWKYYHERGGKEQHKLYRIANRPLINDLYNRYYHSDRGHAIIITIKNRRWSLQNKLLSTLTPEEWLDTLEYFDNSCAYCGTSEADLHRDHVIPLSKGGFYVQSNLVPACKSCNSSKHANDMESWFRAQPFFSESRLKKIYKWTRLKPNSDIQQVSMF